MGKIKQGILGGFKGKVGTVIGASWNGIAYMKGLPQSQKDPKTAAQMRQRTFFREVQNLVGQLTAEQQKFLIPETPQGMTRRNMLAKQLAEDPVVTDDSKTVDLANLKTIGDAPTADLPDVTVSADTLEGSPVLKMQWASENPKMVGAAPMPTSTRPSLLPMSRSARSSSSIPRRQSAHPVKLASPYRCPPTAKPPTPSADSC